MPTKLYVRFFREDRNPKMDDEDGKIRAYSAHFIAQASAGNDVEDREYVGIKIFRQDVPGGRDLTEDGFRQIRATALKIVVDYLAGKRPDTIRRGDVNWITASASDLARYTNDRECTFQELKREGMHCAAKDATDSGQTTRHICTTCTLPDNRIRCVHLSHPKVRAWNSLLDKPSAHLRLAGHAMCDIGKTGAANPENCTLGGHSCWQQVVEISTPTDRLEAGVEERVCDEIDHLNLIFKHYYNHKLIPISQARSIKELLTECKSELQLKTKIQSISALLDKIDVRRLINTTENLPGTISELEAFLVQQAIPYNRATIKILRDLRTIRSDFPAHNPPDKLIKAFRDLGLDFPITNHASAWKMILGIFTTALREVRIDITSTKDSE